LHCFYAKKLRRKALPEINDNRLLSFDMKGDAPVIAHLLFGSPQNHTWAGLAEENDKGNALRVISTGANAVK